MISEKRKAYLAEWRKKNREKLKKQSLSWYYSMKERKGDEFLEKKSALSQESRRRNLEKARMSSKLNARRRRKENKEEVNRQLREYLKKNPDKVKEYTLRKYGLTLEGYRSMVNRQEGKCALCKSEDKLCVDHCHKSGNVRELLCVRCNMMLGGIEKGLELNKDFLLNITEYLRKHEALSD